MITMICRVLAAVTAIATVLVVFQLLGDMNMRFYLGDSGTVLIIVVAAFFLSVSVIEWTCGEIYAKVSTGNLGQYVGRAALPSTPALVGVKDGANRSQSQTPIARASDGAEVAKTFSPVEH